MGLTECLFEGLGHAAVVDDDPERERDTDGVVWAVELCVADWDGVDVETDDDEYVGDSELDAVDTGVDEYVDMGVLDEVTDAVSGVLLEVPLLL